MKTQMIEMKSHLWSKIEGIIYWKQHQKEKHQQAMEQLNQEIGELSREMAKAEIALRTLIYNHPTDNLSLDWRMKMEIEKYHLYRNNKDQQELANKLRLTIKSFETMKELLETHLASNH